MPGHVYLRDHGDVAFLRVGHDLTVLSLGEVPARAAPEAALEPPWVVRFGQVSMAIRQP